MEELKLNIKLLNIYYKQIKRDYKNENVNIEELTDKYNLCISNIYKTLMCLCEGSKLVSEFKNKKLKKSEVVEN